MKQLSILFTFLVLWTIPAMAQKDFGEMTTCTDIVTEDSDLLTNCNDYYTGRFSVRSGDTVYSIGLDKYFNCFELKNTGNHIINQRPYDIRTGDPLHREQPLINVDIATLITIVAEVFPNSEVQGGNTTFQRNTKMTDHTIGFRLAIDPKTMKVHETIFTLYHAKGDKSMYAIPPR